MPYTKAHKDFVEPLLDLDLDGLSTDLETFKEQVAEIKKALTLNPTPAPLNLESKAPVPSTEELKSKFATVQQCFHDPEQHFNRLEDSGGSLTIGELKHQMLEFIQTKFETAAVAAGTTLDWHPRTLITTLSEKEKTKKFSSKKIVQAPEIPIPSGLVYRVSHVTQDASTFHGLMTLYIKFPEEEELKKTYNLGSIQDYDHGFIRKGQELAEKETLSQLIHFLIQKGIIDEVEATQIPSGTKQFLLHPYILHAVLKKEIDIFSDILSEDPSEANRIASAGAADFLATKKSDMGALRLATPSQLRVMGSPFFHKKLLTAAPEDEFNLAKVFELKDESCFNLLYLGNLLQQEKITLKEADAATDGCKEVLRDGFYQEKIERGVFDAKKLINITSKEAAQLLSPHIKKLLSENVLDLDAAIKLSSDQWNLLQFDAIVKLLVEKRLTLKEVYQFSYRTAQLIDTHQLIAELLSKRLLSPTDVTKILVQTLKLESAPGTGALTAAPETSEQKIAFIAVTNEFLVLAEQGILYAKDLNYLFTHFSLVTAEIASIAEEKSASTSTPLKLLLSQSMHERCVKNMMERIKQMVLNKPLALHTAETFDTFALINRACSAIDVNFLQSAFIVLIEEMHATYAHFGTVDIPDIIKTAIKLGFPPEKMWGAAFAIRAFKLYEGLPSLIDNKNDSLGQLIVDMQTIQNKHHFLEPELALHFLKYLQESIQKDLKKNSLRTRSEELQKIHQILVGLEAKTDEASSQLFKKRMDAFAEITTLAQGTMHTSRTESYLVTEDSAKRIRETKEEEAPLKRSRVTLFRYSQADLTANDNLTGVRSLCRGLIDLRPIIDALQPEPTSQLTLTH